MLAHSNGAVQRPHPTRGRALPEHGADEGYSVLEIIVSISLISIVMAAYSTFFVNALAVNAGQGAKQAAVQVAAGAMERVRALKGAAITAGRDEASTLAQWASPVAGVSPYLAQMGKAWDLTPEAGEAVALPTQEAAPIVGYTLHWYIGTCWQPKDTGGDCVKPLLTGTAASNGKVPFFGVVVGVTWSHRSCPLSACTHVEATLVSNSPDDPLFPTGQSPVPPAIDPTPPQGGSVTATGLIGTGPLYSGSTTINLLLNKGTSGVGLADDGYQLHRATGTLASIGGTANGTCSGYGLYTQIGADNPPSPTSDTVPAGTACYKYMYRVPDLMENRAEYLSSDVKIDPTAPSPPALSFTGTTNTYWTGTGTNVFYRSTATSGTFTVVAAATDFQSGIASYTMPAVGTGWSAPSTTDGVQAYSWNAANPVTAAGLRNVVATNHATRTSAAGFTMVADSTAPTAGTITFTDGFTGGYTAGRSVSMTLSPGTDGGSGLNVTSGVLQRARAAVLADGTCATTYSAYVTIATNPGLTYTDSSVSNMSCYKYQYLFTDNVGNQTIPDSATSIAKVSYAGAVNNTSTGIGHWRLGDIGTVVKDSKGVNHGTYYNAPTQGVPGALPNDSDTAVTFNGTTQYATVKREIVDDFTIEFWFKSTGGRNIDADWYTGAGMVDADTMGNGGDFGVTLGADGMIKAGTGSLVNRTDYTVASPVGFNNGAWHHVVFTRVKVGGAMKLYVNGALSDSGIGSTESSTSTPLINFGRSAAGTDYFAGTLDEISAYGTAISATTVLNHYNLGRTSIDGPTGGWVFATGLTGAGNSYTTSTTINLSLSKGTDPDGLALGAQLSRASAVLAADGTCNTWTGYTSIGTADGATAVNTIPAGAACYRYQYLVADTLGNTTTYTSPDVKYDVTAPTTPTLALSAGANAYVGTPTLVYYRPSAGGSFTVTATSTDTQSGIASYQYPNFGTGWSVPSTTNTNTYTWTVNPAVPTPAAQNVTATDNAGRVSAPASFSTVPDPTAPTGGSVSHLNGSTASRSITVTFTNGTDSGSGLNLTSRRLSRSAQPLVNGLCTGTITVLTISNVTSPYTDTTVTNGTCYWYQYAIADNVGNTAVWSSNSVAKVDYATAVNATTSLVGHWRLGEPAISSSDNFTDPAGTVLASHTSQTRTTWARRTGDAITAVITPSGKVRRNGLGNVTYYTSGVPTSADYLVEADLNYQTAIAGNFAGVVGRLDPASGNYYTAGYDGTSFRLRKSVGGVLTDIGTPYDQNLDFGFTYRFGLDMTGSTIRLVVDGKTGGSVVDTGITAAGRAGVHFSNATNAASDTTGMLLDELEVSHQARDEKGLNPGDYHRGPQLGAAGALTDNTAAQFDGANDSLLIPTETNIPKGAAPRTVETWFRTPGVALHQDRQVLFSYGQFATNVLFSAWIEPGGTQLTFGGGRAVANRTFTFPSNVNDNRWHHFAITYNGSALAMYVDGVAGTGGSSPIALNTLNSASGITVGRWTPNSKNLNDGYFNGALDELAIYNDAMTPTTVLEHYSFLQQGPVGGSVDVTGLTPERFATPTALTIALNKGTDADGVAPTGALLYRANGTLDSAGTCSGWTPYLLLDGPADAATKSDTIPNTSACYRYQYVVADNFGGQTTYLSGEIRVDTRPPETSQYDATVKATAGLAGYWRLGETLVFNDTFTDFQSTSLGAHKSDSGGSWTLRVADHIGASINSTGNLYHNNIGGTVYYTNPAPTTANYLVEADVIAKSATTTHIAGVVGRLDSAGTGDGTFYTARYNSTGTPRWELGKVVNGTSTALGTASAETLTIGRAYRLGLDMSGSTIRLLVDGVVRTSATDNDPSLTAAGRAGVRFASTTAFDVQTTGVQLDNFRVASGPLTDARNISHGVYRATGVTLGVPGALVGSRNTAVALNGSAGHGFIPANAALTVNSTFSVEAWVKRGTLGTTQTIMYKGPNGLWWRFDADNKLGLYTGSGQLIFKSNAILTDTTAFHHYVFTYTNVPSISVALYVDGVSVAGTAGAHTPPTDSGQAMYIGSKAALDYFNGTLDEVALYNTVMPLATVTNHYNKGRGN